MDDRIERFAALQRTALPAAWRANQPASHRAHTIVGLPSYSVDSSVYEHFGARIGPLENRFLHAVLLLRRPGMHLVFLSSNPVRADVLEGYLELIPAHERQGVQDRLHLISPEDPGPRPLAAKLLERPDLLRQVKELATAHGPAMVEAWNVTEVERDLALAINVPVFGSPPELRLLGTKSNGRRLMRDAGVPVPPGTEDVRNLEDVVEAVLSLLAKGRGQHGVVVKLDDSVSGDGNIVLPAAVLTSDVRALTTAVRGLLPEWYLAVLTAGGAVEERITGDDLRSPSCQAEVTPDGDIEILATHEQRLGGPDAQVYLGCTCPADPRYAPALADHTEAIGKALAEQGALGRFAVDFMAHRRGQRWQLHALEINLRKGGTTHTMGLTRLLTRARYDAQAGALVDPKGDRVFYAATDNLLEPTWMSRSPADVRRRLTPLRYDPIRRRGVVPHLLDCLPVDGRMGYTAIGHDPADVAGLERQVLELLT